MDAPRVSIGLPVYNGEKYIESAIESMLDQTYKNFEFLISDNGSTDSTPELIEKWAEKDDRIIFLRGRRNLGAQPNYDRLFELSRGEFFSWKAVDDRWDPTWLEQSVKAMDEHQDAVLVYYKAKDIDENGTFIEDVDYEINTTDDNAAKRFLSVMCDPHPCFALFGLIRADVMAQSNLHGNYSGSDRVFLAEMAARGKWFQLGDRLFLHGEVAERSVNTLKYMHQRAGWFDASKKGKLSYPYWRYLKEFSLVVERVDMTKEEKMFARKGIAKWAKENAKNFGRDAARPVKQLRDRLT